MDLATYPRSFNQVRFDEQRFPLLDSPSADISQKFATSTLGGIPNYPKSGATTTLPTGSLSSGHTVRLPINPNVHSDDRTTTEAESDPDSSQNSNSVAHMFGNHISDTQESSTTSAHTTNTDTSNSDDTSSLSHHSDPDFRPSRTLQRYIPDPLESDFQIMEQRVRELEKQLELQQQSAAADLQQLTSQNIGPMNQLDELRDDPHMEVDSASHPTSEYEPLQQQVQDLQHHIQDLNVAHNEEMANRTQEVHRYLELARPYQGSLQS
ncbi:hypothetical protein C6P45_002426 [Maudiozyma exigua]|uniref:Uncharacterized protein n=1 Tax=Maudiozyma exigua TaxID=34358 RepID=A0A9P7B3E4_MAUEX|nr:hypothetical protein C6P45_002426 [Kazachstania exigua]